MTTNEETNIATVRRYFETIAEGPAPDVAGGFYTPDAIQEEFPNRFLPNGARRDLAGIREAAARGKDVMARQAFQLLDAIASGDKVVVEAQWSGTLGVDIGPITKGTTMRARFAVFFEFRNGQIARQRNYDCFDPW
jgi:ketosteroid isomerase-like protein